MFDYEEFDYEDKDLIKPRNNALDLTPIINILYYILRKNSITYSTYKYQIVNFDQYDNVIHIYDIENSEIIPLKKEMKNIQSNNSITLDYNILRSDGFLGTLAIDIYQNSYKPGIIIYTDYDIFIDKKILTRLKNYNTKLTIRCSNITKDILERLYQLLTPIIIL